MVSVVLTWPTAMLHSSFQRISHVVSAMLLVFLLCFCQVFSWDYSDKATWDTVYPDACGGQSQSPIDLDSGSVQYRSSYRNNLFTFSNFNTSDDVTWTLVNNGHAAQVNMGGLEMQMSGGALTGTFQAEQFHFHWGSDNTQGSEHTVDGLKYPLEMHIVTFNTKYDNVSDAASHSDGLAVLGIFFEVSDSDNSHFGSIIRGLSSVRNDDSRTTITAVALENLMPATTDYYRYSGSLTTPNCNEVVTWTVFKETVKISNAQMGVFRTLQDSHNDPLVDNYRPVQPVNSRTVTTSFSAAQGPVSISIFQLSAAFFLAVGIMR